MPITDPCALLTRLCKEPHEREWLEFKVNNCNPQEIGEYVSALANSAMLADRERAFLVFGVDNTTRKPVGTTVDLGSMKGKGAEGIQNWLARNVDPPLMLEFVDFDCHSHKLALICIEPTYERPVRFAGVEYIRIGEHKKRLSDHPQHERALWLATSRRKFEDTVALSNVSEAVLFDLLDTECYYRLTEEEMPKTRAEIARKLETFGAVRSNLEGGFDILNLGAILFAKSVSNFPSIKGKTVRVIKYKGLDKSTSESEQEGVYGYAVAFERFIKFVMQRSTEETYVAGVRRKTSLCPEDAVREVVANALIHQDFTDTGAGPVVEIYSNRIEITNPGNSLIETDRMIDERKSRNEKLAGAMRILGLCEERGGGLDKALLAIEDHHLPAPAFIPSKASMRVVLFGPQPFNKMSKLDKQRACFFHCIIRWIRHEYMSNGSLRERFNLSKDDYQAVSAIISAEVKNKRIVPADPKQGRKNAQYVPYWAR